MVDLHPGVALCQFWKPCTVSTLFVWASRGIEQQKSKDVRRKLKQRTKAYRGRTATEKTFTRSAYMKL